MMVLFLACTGDAVDDSAVVGEVELLGAASCSAQGVGMDERFTLGDIEDAPENPDVGGGWGLVAADLNGDDRTDLFLPNNGADQLFLSDGDGLVQGGSLPPSSDYGAVAGDLDGDGDLDLVVANWGPARVLFNDGAGNFTDGGTFGTDELHFGAALGDADGDGDLDVVLPTRNMDALPEPGDVDGTSLPAGKPSELWLNDGRGGFSDGTDRLPEGTNDGYPFMVSWTDVDLDGDLDLYVSNDHGVGVRSNRIWRNDGGVFVDISDGSGLDIASNSMGAGIGDLNADGVPDYVITAFTNILLESGGDGTWFQSEVARGLWPDGDGRRGVGWGTDFGDLDHDGDLDVVMLFGYFSFQLEDSANQRAQPDGLYLLQDDGSFIQEANSRGFADMGQGRGLVVADLNGDGWLDTAKREVYGPARIHYARCGEGDWLVVELHDQGSPNPDAVGARIEVDGQMRWISAGSTGLSSGGPATAHFGVGDEDEVDVSVVWPDGERQDFPGLPTGQRIRLHR